MTFVTDRVELGEQLLNDNAVLLLSFDACEECDNIQQSQNGGAAAEPQHKISLGVYMDAHILDHMIG